MPDPDRSTPPERALTFGQVAATYERYRPGYPDELVDAVLDYAGPVRTAFEIGAGTGKATRAFAARDIAVTASDPDQAMLDELRRHTPAWVSTVCAPLEEVRTDRRYDLVLAAASLHWTDPARRWPRIAALLVDQGPFASFGGQLSIADPALAAAVVEARGDDLADDGVASPDGTPDDAAMRWPGTELLAHELFTDVQQLRLPRRLVWSRDEVIGHLGTISAYLVLAPDVRAAVLARVAAVLPDRVELTGDIDLHLARRSLAPTS